MYDSLSASVGNTRNHYLQQEIRCFTIRLLVIIWIQLVSCGCSSRAACCGDHDCKGAALAGEFTWQVTLDRL